MNTQDLKFLTVAAVVALSLGLAGCGSSGSNTTMEVPDPEPTAYETALADIRAATTAAAAQAAYDAVKDDVTATDGDKLKAAVSARIAALEMMASAAEQKTALTTAAGKIDTSDLSDADAIAAANAAIAALKAALAAATDVSEADKAMYQGRVEAAEILVATAQSALDHEAQTTALSEAVTALQAIDLSDLSDQAKIDTAKGAIAALRTALAAATELTDAQKTAAMTELAAGNRTVMAAQGSVDTAGQVSVLRDAVDALAAIDLDNLMTQAQIDAANAAIAELDLALAAATGLTDAQKLDATVDVTVAKRKVTAAETTLAENVGNQRKALTEAVAALDEIKLGDLDTAEKITAANDAVMALKTALDGATHISDADKAMYQSQLDDATETVRTAQTGMDRDGRMTEQRTAISDAAATARDAVAMVDDDATDAQVMAADNAVAALKAAIDGAEDLPEGDTDVAGAQGALAALTAVLDSAKKSRMMAKAEDDKAKNAAMMATAMKLYMGIGMPTASDATPAASIRHAKYTDDNVEVTIGAATAVDLMEDKKAMVAANHGWMGKKYTAAPDDDGMYEAAVYSNVGKPTMGKKFGSAVAVTEKGDFEYQLTDGELTLTGLTEFMAKYVAIQSVTRTSGTETFEKGDNQERVMLQGSYHGVSGTYYCAPRDNSSCSAAVAEMGLTLGGGTWKFKPTNANAMVMSTPDSDYASYGWWIHKGADGMWTASAFTDDMGEVPAASGITALKGTATYMGGAAGKYALYSSTGGTNDAGHFTAKAMLEADFNTNMVMGTIDTFIGADGKSRDWTVELMESGVGDDGNIQAKDGLVVTADNPLMKTKWTIGETAAAAAGQWQGMLKDNGEDDVPTIATGTFYSTYSTSGKMVGAFGVNKQ